MMAPPKFWYDPAQKFWPAVLAPFAAITAQLTARRVAKPGFAASVPVICCGNASVGGAGKTTLALYLLHYFREQGFAPASLTRGHGGQTRHAPHRVDPARDSAAEIGDEPLLLAALAPCYVCPDRAAGARAAIKDGANILVLDDGLQNPSLHKDFSFLVIDGASGFGNGCLLPAGPLREPIEAAAARSQAALMIGDDVTCAQSQLPAALPVLRADLIPEASISDFSDQKILAFAGIGRPEKFFSMLRTSGLKLCATRSFPDHHTFSARDLADLQTTAAVHNAILLCTPKDFVRLPKNFPARQIGVALRFRDPAALAKLLAFAPP